MGTANANDADDKINVNLCIELIRFSENILVRNTRKAKMQVILFLLLLLLLLMIIFRSHI